MNRIYLKSLIDSYRRVRNEQYAAASRLKNARRTLSQGEIESLEDILIYPYDGIINTIENEINFVAEQIPVYNNFLSKVDGLSIFDALELLVLFKEIDRFHTLSAFWKFSGFAPVEYCYICDKRYFADKDDAEIWFRKHMIRKNAFYRGPNYCTCMDPKPYLAAEKKTKSMVPDYNEKVKKLCIRIGNKLIRDNGFYKDSYEEFVATEQNRNKSITEIHAINRSKRKVVKLFLYHLYQAWRETEGMEKQKPYSKLPEYKERML